MVDERDIAKVLRRPGVRPALITAAGIFAALIVIGALSSTLGSLGLLVSGYSDGSDFGILWAAQLAGSVTGPLPIAIGVFLCFWQIAPIAANLRLAHVVTRSLLAALVGGLVLFVLTVAYLLLLWLFTATTLFGTGDPLVGSLPGPIGMVFFQSLATVVTEVPVVVLGGILLWGWLQRHPRDHPVKGTLDEV